MPGDQLPRLSAACLAKAIRARLRTQFPSHIFTVRSRDYATGSSVTVRWTDGPTESTLRQLFADLSAVDVDASDCKTVRPLTVELPDGTVGQPCSWIHVRREYSNDAVRDILLQAEVANPEWMRLAEPAKRDAAARIAREWSERNCMSKSAAVQTGRGALV